MSDKLEASQAFLDQIKSDGKVLRGSSVESLIRSQNHKNFLDEDMDSNDRITLSRVMELDGIKRSTPMRQMIEAPYKAYLFAADSANFVKRRFVDDYSSLQTSFSVEKGILASTVGSIHRPSLLDLCGGTEVRIQSLPDNKKGAVGQWKPMELKGDDVFVTAPFEEIFTIRPEYAETTMGSVYKYAFAMQLTEKNTLSGISVDVASRWMDGVLLLLECEMMNHFYQRLIVRGTTIGTQELGSESREGAVYKIDEYAWRGLHNAFGKNHGLTDVFCHKDQEQVIHNMPIRSNALISVGASDALIELRNRLVDGTYVWSRFLDEPEENLVPAIDRKSCAALYYVEDSEIHERKVEALTGSVLITFSITLGFDVLDGAGLKLMEVNNG